jgi:hypothetical protein
VIEKELAFFLEDFFNSLNIPWLHIPNKAYKGGRSLQLKNFPDYVFPYNGNVFMVELGITGRHTDRKTKQLSVMQRWSELGGVKFAMLFSKDGIIDQMKTWGLIK